MACVSKYRRLPSTSCITARSCWYFVFYDKNGWKQKTMSGWDDWWWYCHTTSVCMDLFFLSVSGFHQPHDVTFFGLLGVSPPGPHRDSAPGLPFPRPLPVPLPNQNTGSAREHADYLPSLGGINIAWIFFPSIGHNFLTVHRSASSSRSMSSAAMHTQMFSTNPFTKFNPLK